MARTAGRRRGRAYVRLQPIKPSRLSGLSKDVKDAMKHAMLNHGTKVEKQFGKITRNWSEQPKFVIKVSQRLVLTVTTDSDIFKWVDQGTSAHVIRPRGSGTLRFRPGFTPKTKPGVLKGFAGRSFGAPIETTMVKHPGIEPRNFTRTIEREWGPELGKSLQLAMANAWRKRMIGVRVTTVRSIAYKQQFKFAPFRAVGLQTFGLRVPKYRVQMTGRPAEVIREVRRAVGLGGRYSRQYRRRKHYQTQYRAVRRLSRAASGRFILRTQRALPVTRSYRTRRAIALRQKARAKRSILRIIGR
jgi:hypothetical protein